MRPHRRPTAREHGVASSCVDDVSAGVFAFRLRYLRTDPYAIWMSFEGMDLRCARDLPVDALEGGRCGEGDVAIRDDEDVVYFELPFLGGRVTVHVARDEAGIFIAKSNQLVPLGDDLCHLAVDSAPRELGLLG